MAILGFNLEGKDVPLHFAVPTADAGTFIATPYLFHGTEVAREPAAASVTVGDLTLTPVTVKFRDIW